MPHSRRLVLHLERRDESGTYPLGFWDLTIPALHSIEDGTISDWLAGRVPSSWQLSLSVPHEVRRASWDNCLFYIDPPVLVQRYIDHTKKFPSIDELIRRVEVLISAQRIRAYAEALHEQVRHASPEAPDHRDVTHPITGELIVSNGDGDIAPFHFATMQRRWKGVDPKELFDFTRAFGKPDADAFLSTMLSGAKEKLTNIEQLNDAILTLAHTKDVDHFKEIVQKWNGEQRLILDFGDHSRLITPDGFDGHRAALQWCKDFVRSALQLEDSVKDFLFKPEEPN